MGRGIGSGRVIDGLSARVGVNNLPNFPARLQISARLRRDGYLATGS